MSDSQPAPAATDAAPTAANNPQSDDLLQASIDMLAKLIAFDTTSAYSNLQLIEFVGDYLKQQGLESRLTYDETDKKANLWVTIGPDIAGGVVLSGHTDVVPVADQDWSSDPFVMATRDGKLFGRGTADMKGCLLYTSPSPRDATLSRMPSSA